MELLRSTFEKDCLSGPTTDLHPFISYYYEVCSDDPYLTNAERILLPHAGFTLLFNLSGHSFSLKSGKAEFPVEKHILLPRNKTYFLPSSAHFFSIHFLFSFLPLTIGKSQSEFQEPVNPSSFIDKNFADHIHRLYNFQQRVDFCNSYFTKLFSNYQRRVDRVRFVIEKMQQITNENNYSAEAESNYVASKTLARNFLRYTGGSYKDCFRILRLRNFLKSYMENSKGRKPTAFGFYDYSHFYKEVINITGYTFAELKRFIGNESDVLL